MQDDIVNRLARSLQIQLATVEASRVARVRPGNPDAEDLALQCEASYLRFGLLRKEMLPAYAICEQALRIDGANVRALVILALRLLIEVRTLQSSDPAGDLRKADALITRALAVDSDNYFVYYAKSYLDASERPEEAIAEAEHALALNPSFTPIYSSIWIANWTAGQFEKAEESADIALRLSPHDPLEYVYLGEKGAMSFTRSHYDEASDFYRRSIAANPNYAISYLRLAASLALSGRDAAASETLGRYLLLPPETPKTIALIRSRQPSESRFLSDYYDRLYRGLRKAGMPE